MPRDERRGAGRDRSGRPSAPFSVPHWRRLFDFGKSNVEDWVFLPVLEVEVPPLIRLDGEVVALHRLSQQIASRTLFGGAAGIIRIRARRHLVVSTGHLDRLAGGQ